MPKMRRLTTYIASSAALATGVVTWAFYERPNFYSAVVYLSQSNACLMVLLNLALIIGCSFMYGMQQLLFGPLRPIEIEQLYERSWFAITEWLFAMSTFRDEFGPLFLLMFSGLFVGKVWGWIAEGRIEMLEQQPPANPRLFHTRLVASLLLYVALAFRVAWFCLDAVISEAKPGVMVMFVFEFAIILISALSASLRYAFWAVEQEITRRQVKQRVETQRAAIRRTREQALAEGNTEAAEAAGNEDEINEDDIEVPGWEAKGAWLFGLDIGTDFLKLVAYMAFFTILTVFYGIPIYIIRDMYITVRSFTKRVADYAKYQRATRDMHRRYPDATAEELASDNTCIVCREDMQPWAEVGGDAAGGQAVPERQRPKKLPCGHILHFGCLRSWLERQQVCPICRRSVLSEPLAARTALQPGEAPPAQPAAQAPRAADLINDLFGPPAANDPNNNNNNQPQRPNPNNPPQNPQPLQPNQQQPPHPQPRMRRFRFGPIRFEFGYAAVPAQPANNENIRNLLEQMQQVRRNAEALGDAIRNPTPAMQNIILENGGTAADAGSTSSTDPAVQRLRQGFNIGLAQLQLNQYDEFLRREFQALNATRHRVEVTRQLFRELERSRAEMDTLQQQEQQVQNFPAAFASATAQNPAVALNGQHLSPITGMPFGHPPWGAAPMQFARSSGGGPILGVQQIPLQNFNALTNNLPEGMVLPPGYQVIPLAPAGPLAQGAGPHLGAEAVGNIPAPTPTVTVNATDNMGIASSFSVGGNDSGAAVVNVTTPTPEIGQLQEPAAQVSGHENSRAQTPRTATPNSTSPPGSRPNGTVQEESRPVSSTARSTTPSSSFTSGANWSFPSGNGSAHQDAQGNGIRSRDTAVNKQPMVEDAEEE